jgi:hypothetical protein
MAKNIPPPPYEGGCYCGAIRYKINVEPLSIYACHCTHCQQQGGSAFNMSMLVPAAGMEVTKGELKQTHRVADSGNKIFGYFCPDCGIRLFHRPEANDQMRIVRPGTLDDTSWVKPIAFVWTQSKQPWFELPEGIPSFEKGPPEFKMLLDLWADA